MITRTIDQSLVTPHWSRRLLGAQSASFYLRDDDLWLQLDDGESYQVLSDNLLLEQPLQSGLFFASLVILSDRGLLQFRGLRRRDAEQLHEAMQDYWYERLLPQVGDAAQTIRQLMTLGYLREERLQQVQQLAQSTRALYQQAPAREWLNAQERRDFDLLEKYANWGGEQFAAFRQRYLDLCQQTYRDFFQTVESNPLTEAQQRACLIDETNNLVLAGAGTGKTSVMIGRVGFLLRSQQAQPEQILLLAFGNKAAVEMQQRLDDKIGRADVVASTFHSLGKYIITQVEGQSPSLSVLAEGDSALVAQVSEWLEQQLQQPTYRTQVLDYLTQFAFSVRDPFTCTTQGDYFADLLAQNVQTLQGQRMQSLSAVVIGNYLTRMGINYQYQADYDFAGDADLTLDSPYQPDFYLPDDQLYIEHFMLDRQGQTPSWLESGRYQQRIAWIRQQHQRQQTRLLETYQYDYCDGQFLNVLQQKLQVAGVALQPLTDEEYLQLWREQGAVEDFASLLAQLLRRTKANWFHQRQLQQKIQQAPNPSQVQAALALLRPILQKYQQTLQQQQQIDFDDMIGKALQYVQQGRFCSPWKYLLVDEFQDISDPRARLIKALRDQYEGASLFCVGDDWQAIYRFSGSDIRFTTRFREVFGATVVSCLDTTFRFNNRISEVASRFVQQNPAQLPKQLSTLQQQDEAAVFLLQRSRPVVPDIEVGNAAPVPRVDPALAYVCTHIAAVETRPLTLYFLARYHRSLPSSAELQTLRQQYPQWRIEAMSIHASKGKEADYVICVGLEAGRYGFPAQQQSHPLLEALLPKPEAYADAEERRLFYVALTRAKQRVYLLADMAKPSSFVRELLDEHYPLEVIDFDGQMAGQLEGQVNGLVWHPSPCPQCQSGQLQPRQSEHGRFLGCSHYPLCKYTQIACQQCGSPLLTKGRFKLCSNDACRQWLPSCLQCGASMVKREGEHGEFWGCSQFASGRCRHTEQVIDSPYDSADPELIKNQEV